MMSLKRLNIQEACKTYEVTYINNPFVGAGRTRIRACGRSSWMTVQRIARLYRDRHLRLGGKNALIF